MYLFNKITDFIQTTSVCVYCYIYCYVLDKRNKLIYVKMILK